MVSFCRLRAVENVDWKKLRRFWFEMFILRLAR